MNVSEAMAAVKADIRPGLRGVGSATIVLADGREYGVVSELDILVERFSADGELIERVEASEVAGAVAEIRWRVDESGGVYPP
jgi:hypothetical protein